MKRVVWKLGVIVVVSVFGLIDRILPGGKQIAPRDPTDEVRRPR
jgi:hypothetical protein